jgi:hypothetical protein
VLDRNSHAAKNLRPLSPLSQNSTTKVAIFGDGLEELGAVRYQGEWITVKPSFKDNDSIDPYPNTDTHIEYRPDKDA